MMNNLDPWKLTRIPIAEKHRLPQASGLYFVFRNDKLLYVGKTDRTFIYRWLAMKHHREGQLIQMGGVEIACLECAEKGSALASLEKQAIKAFKPMLNGQPLNTAKTLPRITISALSPFHYKWARLWAYARGESLSQLITSVFQAELEREKTMIEGMIKDIAGQRKVSAEVFINFVLKRKAQV